MLAKIPLQNLHHLVCTPCVGNREVRGIQLLTSGGGTGAAALLLQGKEAVKGLEHKS